MISFGLFLTERRVALSEIQTFLKVEILLIMVSFICLLIAINLTNMYSDYAHYHYYLMCQHYIYIFLGGWGSRKQFAGSRKLL